MWDCMACMQNNSIGLMQSTSLAHKILKSALSWCKVQVLHTKSWKAHQVGARLAYGRFLKSSWGGSYLTLHNFLWKWKSIYLCLLFVSVIGTLNRYFILPIFWWKCIAHSKQFGLCILKRWLSFTIYNFFYFMWSFPIEIQGDWWKTVNCIFSPIATLRLHFIQKIKYNMSKYFELKKNCVSLGLWKHLCEGK